MIDHELINAKAKEYAQLDPVSDKERRQTLLEEIWLFELGLLKRDRNGKAWFPLIKDFAGQIAYDDYYDALSDALQYLFINYDPSRSSNASFTTALKYILSRRLIDKYKKQMKMQNEEKSTIVMGNDGEEYNLLDDIPASELDVPDYVDTEFGVFCRLAIIVKECKEAEKGRPRNKCKFFEGFFTFDTAKLTKEGYFTEQELCNKDEQLFPIMEKVMLCYLMFGNFISMLDVIQNTLRSPDILNRRSVAMCECYGMSRPSIAKRNEAYKILFDAI